ncbi:hypothetical protein BGZ83_010078 [Gryganskiella cystojenkinii]|nr:hypothetical protein BGZ83_010078 [Gryganskiella cystojenkinii]
MTGPFLDSHQLQQQQLYQTFRERGGRLIRIPVTSNPSTGENYVIWTDAQDCFPHLHRVQHGDIFVPMLRDKDLYRIKPHGIRHYPGVVLDVIYKDDLGLDVSPQTGNGVEQKVLDSENTSAASRTKEDQRHDIVHPQDSQVHGHIATNSSPNSCSLDTSTINRRSQPPRNLPQVMQQPQQPEDKQADLYQLTSESPMSPQDQNDSQLSESHKRSDLRSQNQQSEATTTAPVQKPTDTSPSSSEPSTDFKLDSVKALPDDIAEVLEESPSSESSHSPSLQPTEMYTSEEEDGQGAEYTEKINGSNTEDNDEVDGSEVSPTSTQVPRGHEQDNLQSDDTILNRESQQESGVDKEHRPNEKIKLAVPLKKKSPVQETARLMAEQREDLINKLSILNVPGQPLDFNEHYSLVAEAIGHRARDILDRRYRWSESLMPKLFVPVALNSEVASTSVDTTDIAIQFCCDCGEIPGSHDPDRVWHPHCIPTAEAYRVDSKTLKTIIGIYGDYMMIVLEMLLFGAYLDENRRVVAYHLDSVLQQQYYDAYKLMTSYGVKPTVEILNETSHMSREERLASIPRIKTLEGYADFKGLMDILGAQRPFQDWHACLTEDKDVRWVCEAHLYGVKPNQWPQDAASIKAVDNSMHIGYDLSLDTFRAVLSSSIMACEVFDRLPPLSHCVSRLYLTWTFAIQDYFVFSEVISECTSTAVTIEMCLPDAGDQLLRGFEKGTDIGLGHLLIAALKNKNIEFFRLTIEEPDDGYLEILEEQDDDLLNFESTEFGGPIACFKKDPKTGRIDLRACVEGIDSALSSLREAVKGLHNFAMLDFTVLTGVHDVKVRFAEPEQVLKAGGIIEDTNYPGSKVDDFFAKRGFVDKVIYSRKDTLWTDNVFLGGSVLTELDLVFSLVKDRERVRNLIKANKSLQVLSLQNKVMDDPGQIYESLKSLIMNHPALDELNVFHPHQRGTSVSGISTFRWRHCQDPQKFSVEINCNSQDKVGTMLQKYTSTITMLTIKGMSDADANILERSFRPKKGPFKLHHVSIVNPHSMRGVIHEVLPKLILRADLEVVEIAGDVPLMTTKKGNRDNNNNLASAAATYSNLITALSSKVTLISLRGKGLQQLLARLNLSPEAAVLPLLTTLFLSFESDPVNCEDPMLAYDWLKSLLVYKTPLECRLLQENDHLVVDQDGRLLCEEEQERSQNHPAVTKGSSHKTLERPIRYQYEKYGIQPLRSFRIVDACVPEKDWNILLQLLDWSNLEVFCLNADNPISAKVLKEYLLRYLTQEAFEGLVISADGSLGYNGGAITRIFEIDGGDPETTKSDELWKIIIELDQRIETANKIKKERKQKSNEKDLLSVAAAVTTTVTKDKKGNGKARTADERPQQQQPQQQQQQQNQADVPHSVALALKGNYWPKTIPEAHVKVSISGVSKNYLLDQYFD